MSDKYDFYRGEIVFDKKRTDPTDDLLVVVDEDAGTVGDLSGETKRKVKHNETNKELNDGHEVPEYEPCVTASYISADTPPTVGDAIYTFPAFRLATVESPNSGGISGYQPYQWALAGFLAELMAALHNSDVTIESTEDLQVLCMQASIDGEVITRGTEWGLGKSFTKKS